MSVPGLERGIAILRLFRRDRSLLAPAEIAAELAIPRSTVHRLLGELRELGLIRRSGDGRYGLDVGVLSIGFEYLASNDVAAMAGPVLEALRDQTNWSTHLAVRQGRSIVYLSRYASRAAVSRNVTVGSSLPAHATLMGRVLLADLEPTDLRALYADAADELDRGGPAAPHNIGDLQRLIDADRSRGYASADGFYEAGVRAVAAPVRDISLSTIAAINATAVGGDTSDLPNVAVAVAEAAARISRLMGAPAAIPDIAFANMEHEKWA
jgi:DNA-binding IclR family transcriptional regulator